MQFLAARSRCMNLLVLRYSMPLAISAMNLTSIWVGRNWGSRVRRGGSGGQQHPREPSFSSFPSCVHQLCPPMAEPPWLWNCTHPLSEALETLMLYHPLLLPLHLHLLLFLPLALHTALCTHATLLPTSQRGMHPTQMSSPRTQLPPSLRSSPGEAKAFPVPWPPAIAIYHSSYFISFLALQSSGSFVCSLALAWSPCCEEAVGEQALGHPGLAASEQRLVPGRCSVNTWDQMTDGQVNAPHHWLVPKPGIEEEAVEVSMFHEREDDHRRWEALAFGALETNA